MIVSKTTTNVKDFKVNEIYNFNTGKIEQADYWLKQSPTVINKLKSAIKNNKKSYGCPFCKTPLVLKVGNKKQAHFSHAHPPIGKSCRLANAETMPSTVSSNQQQDKTVPHTWTSTFAYTATNFTSTATAVDFVKPAKEVAKPQQDFAKMSEKKVLNLLFENKFSRSYNGLKNRLKDLLLEGYTFSENIIEELETAGAIEQLDLNLSQIHYRKALFAL